MKLFIIWMKAFIATHSNVLYVCVLCINDYIVEFDFNDNLSGGITNSFEHDWNNSMHLYWWKHPSYRNWMWILIVHASMKNSLMSVSHYRRTLHFISLQLGFTLFLCPRNEGKTENLFAFYRNFEVVFECFVIFYTHKLC